MSVVTQDHSYGGASEGSEKIITHNDETTVNANPDVKDVVTLEKQAIDVNKSSCNDANINKCISPENNEANTTEETIMDKGSVERNNMAINTSEKRTEVADAVSQCLSDAIDISESLTNTDEKTTAEKPEDETHSDKTLQKSSSANTKTVSVPDAFINSTKDAEKTPETPLKESYFCGVCQEEFGAMLELHEHMVNVEKVKSYKYSIENRTADVSVDDGQSKSESTQGPERSLRKRGRKRKQELSNSPEIDKNKNQKNETQINMRRSSPRYEMENRDLIEQQLIKFEKTVETKSAHSAFFSPVVHSYGTRRRSFLKLKEGNSPENINVRNGPKGNRGKKTNFKQQAKKGQLKKTEHVIESDYDISAAPEEVNTDVKPEMDEESEGEVGLNTDDKTDEMESTINHIERVKPDGTVAVTLEPDNTQNQSSDESDRDYKANEDDSNDAEYYPEEDHDKDEIAKRKIKRGYSRKRVECAVCGKTFRRCMIERHMVKHSTSRDWECDVCHKFYKTKLQRDEHRKKIHFDLKLFRCTSCGKVLKNKYGAEKHITLHLLKSEPAEVEEFDQSELQIVKQEVTNRRIEIDIDRSDPQIGHTDIADDKMGTGLNGHDESSIPVELEDGKVVNGNRETINTYDVFNLTKVTSNDLEYHNCNKCEAMFISKGALNSHKAKEHATQKQHECKLCHKVFKKFYRLRDHCLSNHDNMKFTCNVCQTVLTTDRGLWAHKGRHLSKSDPFYSEEVAKAIQEEHKTRMGLKVYPKVVICSICGKEVLSKRFLRHMNSHNTSRDYECDICHKRYTTKRYVTDHKLKSHGNKTSFCDICGHTFKGTQYLEKHKQIHGPKDKMCNLCGKGFTTEFYLKVHMVTHAGRKQHKCSLCESAFKHKARLDIHMLERHSKGQDRPCKHCGLLFPSRQKARLHERRVHEGFVTPSRSRRGSSMRKKVIHIQQDGQEVRYAMELPAGNDIVDQMDQSEAEESVEQIIEIPENSEQCQLMILPNGVIKCFQILSATEELRRAEVQIRVVLNVVEGEGETTVNDGGENDNYTIQYVTEDGEEVMEGEEPEVQYVEVNESEFKLMTEGKSTQVVEILEQAEKIETDQIVGIVEPAVMKND